MMWAVYVDDRLVAMFLDEDMAYLYVDTLHPILSRSVKGVGVAEGMYELYAELTAGRM